MTGSLGISERVDAAVDSIDQALVILLTDPETAGSGDVEELREVKTELLNARLRGDLGALESGLEQLRSVTRRLLGIDRANP